MEIKRARPAGWASKLAGALRGRTVARAAVLTVLFIALQLLLVFGSMYYAVQLYTSGQVNAYHEVIDQVLEAASRPGRTVARMVQGRMARPERLVFDFQFEDWQALAAKHNEAFKERTLYASDNPTFPATIRLPDKNVDVDVRLKGAPPHFMGHKWSLRVEVDESDETIFGMKTFSLQHPKTRQYLGEWIAHKLMKREGVIALNYDFVEVVINGRNEGVYALEEHFSKELVERAGRREGPIVWMSEELYNLNRWQDTWVNEARQVDSYQTRKTVQDEELAKQFVAARSLIERFGRGDMATCEVFECDLLAKYFAGLDLLGAEHAAESGNMKMYYNPVTSRLEPIVFDVESEYTRKHLFLRTWSNYDAQDSTAWIRQIFSDPEFMEQYLRELTRMVEPDYLNSFFSEIEAEMNEKLAVLYRSFPTYEFDTESIYAVQDRIRAVLEAQKGLDAYVESVDERHLTIEAGTILPFPVVVRGIQCPGGSVALAQPPRLDPLMVDQVISYDEITFELPAGVDAAHCEGEELLVAYTVLGRDDVRLEAPSLLPREAHFFGGADVVRQSANHRTFDFVRVDEAERRIIVEQGSWALFGDLVIPEGYTFTIGAGTELDLRNSARIISHSPLLFEGARDAPVRIISSDGSGQGVVVLNTDERSRLAHVIFDNLSAPRSEVWSLTGAVTFYEAATELQHVRFERNHDSDDALNVIRSEYAMEDVLFVDVPSDGLDSDFSTGRIVRSRVVNAGGDGFDFSGSTAELEDIFLTGIGDKGLSIGEMSTVEAQNVAVRDCAVAVASKDFSDASILGLALETCDVGMALYQKKPEFGFARMSVWNLTAADVAERFVVEEGSILSLDAVAQPTTAGRVGDRF